MEGESIRDVEMAEHMAYAEKPLRDELREKLEEAEKLGLKAQVAGRMNAKIEQKANDKSEMVKGAYESAQEEVEEFVTAAIVEGEATWANPYEDDSETKEAYKTFKEVFPSFVRSRLNLGESTHFSLSEWERDEDGLESIKLSYKG